MAGECHGGRVTALALVGSEVWSGGGANGLILVHSILSGSLLSRLFTPHRTEEDRVLCFSSLNGAHMWIGESQGAIAVFSREARSVQAEAEERQHGSVYTLCAIDNISCWAGYADGSLILWHLASISSQVQAASSPLSSPSLCATVRITLSATVRALALPALGGGLLWAALDDGTVVQLDSSTGRKVRNAGEGGAALLCVSVCGGGRVVCGGSADGSVCFFDAPSGRLLADVRAHSSRVTALAADATGGVWSVSTDRTVRHWNEVPQQQAAAQCTGVPLEPCIGLLWAVTCFARTLVLGTGDGTLHFLTNSASSSADETSSSLSLLTSNGTSHSPIDHASLPVVPHGSSASAGEDATMLTTRHEESSKEKEMDNNNEKAREVKKEKEKQKEKEREAEMLLYREREQEAEREAEQRRLRAQEAERAVMLEREQRKREHRQREREQERLAAIEREERVKLMESDRTRSQEEQQQVAERERERQLEKDAEAERARQELRRLRAQLKETETELGAARAQCRRLEAQLSPPSPPSPVGNSSSTLPSLATPSLPPHTPIGTPSASTPVPSSSRLPSPPAEYLPPRPPTFSSSSYSPDLPSPSPPPASSSFLSLSPPPRPSPTAARTSPANPNNSASLAAAMAALNAERRALDARLDATCRQAAALRLI